MLYLYSRGRDLLSPTFREAARVAGLHASASALKLVPMSTGGASVIRALAPVHRARRPDRPLANPANATPSRHQSGTRYTSHTPAGARPQSLAHQQPRTFFANLLKRQHDDSWSALPHRASGAALSVHSRDVPRFD